MNIREVEAKSILIKRRKIDSWFVSHYGMNLYRGCEHNCVYCDGRAERYYVDGVFGENVTVKINAAEVLDKELDRKRRRVKLKPSYIMLGGGVGDSYQPVEERYELTLRTLKLLKKHSWPVHILTKSTLVERDLNLIKEINQQNGAIVSFSFSSVDDGVSSVFEPFVPPPSERLRTVSKFKREGVPCGMFLLPAIPFITDTPRMIEDALRKGRCAGVDFVVFGGMTLKDGRQRDYFYELLHGKYPELVAKYDSTYVGDEWGHASGDYYSNIYSVFNKLSRAFGLPRRIPSPLFKDILWENDLVIVILEHLDYFMKLEGKRSSFGYAAFSISKINEPLSSIKGELRGIRGVGEKTEEIILELLETGGSSFYEEYV